MNADEHGLGSQGVDGLRVRPFCVLSPASLVATGGSRGFSSSTVAAARGENKNLTMRFSRRFRSGALSAEDSTPYNARSTNSLPLGRCVAFVGVNMQGPLLRNDQSNQRDLALARECG